MSTPRGRRQTPSTDEGFRLAPPNVSRCHGSVTGRAPATHRRKADQGQPLERSRRKPRHHEPSRPDMAEWNTRVAACDGFTPGEARKNDEITTLRGKLADKTRECTKLSHQLNAGGSAAEHRGVDCSRRHLGVYLECSCRRTRARRPWSMSEPHDLFGIVAILRIP